MANFVERGYKSFKIASSVAQYLRVKCAASQVGDPVGANPIVALAGAADMTVGTTWEAAFTTTDALGKTVNANVLVRLASAEGTVIGTLDTTSSVVPGTPLYSGGSGCVSISQASGASLLGYSLGTAAATGDFVEYLPV